MDDENEYYQKTRNDYLEDLRKKLEDADTIIEQSISNVLANADIAFSTLNETSATYGITLSDNLINPWNTAAENATSWKELVSDYLTSMTNSDGVITVFGSDTTRVLGDVDKALASTGKNANDFKVNMETDFGLSGTAATKFATSVETACTDVKESIGNEKAGFTAELAENLKYPWEQVEGKDSALTTFSSKVETQLDNAITYAQKNYQSVMQEILEAPWKNADLSTYSESVEEQLKNLIEKARAAEAEINNITDTSTPSYTTTTTTTAGNGNNGNNGGSKGNSNVVALQNFLNEYWGQTLSVDGLYGKKTIDAVTYMQKSINEYLTRKGVGTVTKTDGLYGSGTVSALNVYYDIFAAAEGVSKYRNIKNKIPPAYYAKGTIGTQKDQWSITDEYGPELTMYATPEGTLSYMRAGSTVIPADETKKILEMVNTYQPDMLNGSIIKPLVNNVVTNNNSSVSLSFDSFIKAENISDATMPELSKMIDKKIDEFSKKLNYALRRA